MGEIPLKTTTAALPKPLCRKCNIREAILDSRTHPVCRDCYISFVASKCSKQLSLLSRDLVRLSGSTDSNSTGTSTSNNSSKPSGHTKQKRYLVGLSLGTSSSALVHLLNQMLEDQASRGRKLTHHIAVVHVDTDLSPSSPSSASPPPPPPDVAAAAASPARVLLDAYRARYPRLRFRRVPVASALALRSVDWDALTPPPSSSSSSSSSLPSLSSATRPPTSPRELAFAPPHEQRDFLRHLLERLPSATSVADVMRILVRHVLLAETVSGEEDPATGRTVSDKDTTDRQHQEGEEEDGKEDGEGQGRSSPPPTGYQALLLGHTTTALAELTLAEAAKGRGFALPWLANDGPVVVVRGRRNIVGTSDRGRADDARDMLAAAAAAAASKPEPEPTATEILVYHPLRDVMRRELTTFVTLADPPIPGVLPSSALPAAAAATARTAARPSAVVSHKDLSIEEVMARYFADVEANYPSVVANVARTTGKLARLLGGGVCGSGAARACGVCGMPLDELGDERWRGEIGGVVGPGGGGDDSGEGVRRAAGLCYGCERSIYG